MRKILLGEMMTDLRSTQDFMQPTENQLSMKSYEVVLGGVSLKLLSSHDEEFVNELISYLDGKIKDALAQVKSGSLQTAALLAALNVSEELVLLKREAREELKRVESRAQKIISGLESSKIPKVDLNQ